jgi:hypothetical protein
MAIDPRISLAATVAPQVNVADIFNRVKQQQQNLELGEQKLAMNEQTIAQQGVNASNQAQNQQQKTELGNLNIAQKVGANQDATNSRILKSVNDFAIANQSIINEAVSTKNPVILQQALVKRRAELVQQGLPTEQTDEGIAMLGQGNIQGVVSALGDSVKLFNQQQGQQQNQGASAGTREFQNLLDIAQNPNSTKLEQDSANRALGNLARAGSSAQERVATDPTLGAQVATQKGSESTATEQAKSDVKIAEAQRLEQETEGGRQGIESRRLNIDETKINNEQQKQDAINAKNSRRAEADSAVSQVSSLLTGDRFSAAFGKIVTNTPDIAKSQRSIDAIADINQIKGLLTLESRQKLKGQGTISDGEQKILAESATVLNNPLISDERARRELRKIRNVFEAASDRNQLKKETKEKPVIIRFDAQGNQI